MVDIKKDEVNKEVVVEQKEVKDWEEVEIVQDNVVSFNNKDDSFVGTLLSVEESVLYKNNKVYVFDDHSGEKKKIYGTTILDRKLSGVEVGTICRITFLGNKISNTTNRQYKDFKVEKSTNK